MVEQCSQPVPPAFTQALKVLCDGCAQGENVGELTSAIITPRPDVKIIFSIKDAAGSKSFDKIFSGRVNRDQRNLVVTTVQLGLASQPVHEGGIIVIEVERNHSLLEIFIFGINPESIDRIRASISHEFGFGIIKDDGHRSALRIEVPRNWRC
jgi:hypothetical protein